MDQVKKRQLRGVIGWIAVVAVIVMLAAIPLLARSEAEAPGGTVQILSDTARTTSIQTVLRGAGTLAGQEAVEITVPTGIKLEKYLVRNGETVSAGDAVAEVDPVSTLNAIVQVQEKLDALKQALMDAADAETALHLKSGTAGVVKVVYAQAGDNAGDVMLEHGALAVLSLDGRMAVKLNCVSQLSVGETVTVILVDGSEIPGRVESNLCGTMVVSVKDEGYSIGVPVTVSDGDTALGSGELYVHNAWNAVAWSGTVDAVSVRPENTVEAGDVLLELVDTDAAAKYKALAEEHREYEQMMLTLFRLYESGVVTAECGGVVSGIDEESSLLLRNDHTLTDFSLNDTTILTVIPQDTMTLTVTLDERDIGRVSLGQTAQVKVDALMDQTFDAVVTAIGTRGINNGGSSKFSVELTMERGEKMLPGMRGCAEIILDTAADLLAIPVAALCEQGNQTVVYTGFDAKKGELTNPVIVSTGVSDGTMVQILSGLEEGCTCYYPYFACRSETDSR